MHEARNLIYQFNRNDPDYLGHVKKGMLVWIKTVALTGDAWMSRGLDWPKYGKSFIGYVYSTLAKSEHVLCTTKDSSIELSYGRRIFAHNTFWDMKGRSRLFPASVKLCHLTQFECNLIHWRKCIRDRHWSRQEHRSRCREWVLLLTSEEESHFHKPGSTVCDHYYDVTELNNDVILLTKWQSRRTLGVKIFMAFLY